MKNWTKRRSKLVEEAGEEHHGKATKVKGRRRLEKENRHIETKNNVQEGLLQ